MIFIIEQDINLYNEKSQSSVDLFSRISIIKNEKNINNNQIIENKANLNILNDKNRDVISSMITANKNK